MAEISERKILILIITPALDPSSTVRGSLPGKATPLLRRILLGEGVGIAATVAPLGLVSGHTHREQVLSGWGRA